VRKIMTISRIESAIQRLCQEIHQSQKSYSWQTARESQLLFELVACILGSQVSYEMASTAAHAIRAAGLLKSPTERYSVEDYEDVVILTLRGPLHHRQWPSSGRRYRFAATRAAHISRTVWAIYSESGSLKQRLQAWRTAEEARRSMVEIAVGIGPKQASLFLRNIGFTEELAILDSHVLRFMSMAGLIRHPNAPRTYLPAYERYEASLRNYALSSGWSLGCLDLAIWVVMRVFLQEAEA